MKNTMIPKKIHYCWFGNNPKPMLAHKCIKSWKKYCPKFEIIEWNETNVDISSCPLYVRQAYEAKQWAFVTDYIRLKSVYEQGGVYLDTDVELIRGIDELLNYPAYFGFEDGIHIATGLGFGAEKGHYIIKELLDDYASISFFLEDGSFDRTPCPVRNTTIFLKHGLHQDNSKQLLDNNILIFPSDYLCPISYRTNEKRITENTISIHWFNASWQTPREKEKQKKEQRRVRREYRIDIIKHIPNIILKSTLGEKRYNHLKNRFKH